MFLKKELMSIPVFGWCLKKLNCIPIYRGKTTKNNLNFSDQIMQNISNGKTLIIFLKELEYLTMKMFHLKRALEEYMKT